MKLILEEAASEGNIPSFDEILEANRDVLEWIKEKRDWLMRYVRTFLYKYDSDEKVKKWRWFLVSMNSYKGTKAVHIKMKEMSISNEFQHQIHCTGEIYNGVHKPTIHSITRLEENDAIPNTAYCYEEGVIVEGTFYGDQVNGETSVEFYCCKPTEQTKVYIPISFKNREVNHSCKYKTG